MSRENDGRDKHTGTIKLKLSTFIFCSAKKYIRFRKVCVLLSWDEWNENNRECENSNGLNMEFVYKIWSIRDKIK